MTVKTLEIKKAAQESKKYVETFLNRTCSHNLETIVKGTQNTSMPFMQNTIALILLMTFLLRGKNRGVVIGLRRTSGKLSEFVLEKHTKCEEPIN